jgi:F-type H+-transporting ATPase subunit b
VSARLEPAAWLLAAAACLPATALASGEENVAADIFWRVFNVALLLAVLYVTARKPIQGFFRDRRDRIQGEVQTAAQQRKQEEARHAKLQRQLAELEGELERIRHTARQRAEQESERILSDARASADRIREDARIAIEQELRRAREELRAEASSLSVELASGLLRDQVTDADRTRLLDDFIAEVERAPANGSGS